MKTETVKIGKTPEGQPVQGITCSGENGLQVRLSDYGALLLGVKSPDSKGKCEEITLGFDSIEGYFQRHPYFGATVGRFCNRIGKASFSIGGKEYRLAENDGRNHLHGGVTGFDRRMWKTAVRENDDAVTVEFRYLSPDGEEGYPGNLEVLSSYTITDENEIIIEYEAATDAPTPLNLTNHAYWNLGGAGSGDILDHELRIHADYYLETDTELIPTGNILPVTDTPRDFRQGKVIIDKNNPDKPLDMGGKTGFDHCFVIRKEKPGSLVRAAEISDPESGRIMEVETTQPAIQLYTGNSLDGSPAGNGYAQHAGFCLETQHYPDSPNHPEFPSTILRPGEKFSQKTIYRLLAR